MPWDKGRGGALLRVTIILLLIFVLVYGLYVGYFYTIQRHAIFPRHLIAIPQRSIADFPGWQQEWISLADAKVESWYLPPAPRPDGHQAPVIIITHGNGDLMESWAGQVALLQQQGLGVLLVEYPGYGRSTGEPSQARIAASLAAAYDRLVQRPEVDPDRIILFGFSVGGGAIGTLAAARPSAALILMSTFTSVRAMAAQFYLPGWLVRDPFDNLAVVQTYPNPLLIIHGTKDTTIPVANGVALHQAAPGSKLMLLPCGHANCIDDWDEFWLLILDFLRQRGVLE